MGSWQAGRRPGTWVKFDADPVSACHPEAEGAETNRQVAVKQRLSWD